MSVFLRWGVFGILGVAALLYAYNASKRLAQVHPGNAQAVAVEPASAPGDDDSGDADVPVAQSIEPAPPPASAPPHCETELIVAQRAIELKKAGAPLDRVLRIQEIAWEEVRARRERLAQVATRWYGYEGSFGPDALRVAVINDCRQFAPAP